MNEHKIETTMKEIIVEVSEDKYQFFLELLDSLKFVKVKRTLETKSIRRERTFEAIELDTRGYKFDREEAFER